jgi:hypothetical protein
MSINTTMKDKQRFLRWLVSYPSKYSSATNKEILKHMFQIIHGWICSYEEIEIIPVKEILLVKFYLFMFTHEYPSSSMPEEEFDYVSMRYTDEIVDIFLQVRDISDSYGGNFFHKKYDSADRLLQFITSNCMIIDYRDFMENEEEITEEYY